MSNEKEVSKPRAEVQVCRVRADEKEGEWYSMFGDEVRNHPRLRELLERNFDCFCIDQGDCGETSLVELCIYTREEKYPVRRLPFAVAIVWLRCMQMVLPDLLAVHGQALLC